MSVTAGADWELMADLIQNYHERSGWCGSALVSRGWSALIL